MDAAFVITWWFWNFIPRQHFLWSVSPLQIREATCVGCADGRQRRLLAPWPFCLGVEWVAVMRSRVLESEGLICLLYVPAPGSHGPLSLFFPVTEAAFAEVTDGNWERTNCLCKTLSGGLFIFESDAANTSSSVFPELLDKHHPIRYWEHRYCQGGTGCNWETEELSPAERYVSRQCSLWQTPGE